MMRYQLIKKDNTINLSGFKKVIKDLDWKKIPRKTGDRIEFFYSGRLDTSEKIITVVIRPSLSMTVTEMFKKHENGKTELFGHSAESHISETFLSKLLEKVGKIKDGKPKNKILEW